jgi:hypothetical protein
LADTFPVLQQSAALYAAAASSIYSVASACLIEGEKSGNLPKQDSKEFNEMMGGLMSSVVLHAFALELALKALCVKRGQAYPKTHDLSKLFDLLPPDDRAAAAKGYEQRHPNSKAKGGLEGLLKANAHAFEEWRYQHEYKPQTIVSEDLSIAFDQIYALSK